MKGNPSQLTGKLDQDLQSLQGLFDSLLKVSMIVGSENFLDLQAQGVQCVFDTGFTKFW